MFLTCLLQEFNRTSEAFHYVADEDLVKGFDIGQHEELVDVGRVADVVFLVTNSEF